MSLHDPIGPIAEFHGMSMPIPPSPIVRNPAEWTYERLGRYIKEFEANLDEEHEIGARLVCFGSEVKFHIEDLGYHGPDIICFYGQNAHGEKLQLIQNISQLSVLLIAMKKLGPQPRRIGFGENPNPEPE